MAEVSYLHLHDGDDGRDDVVVTLDSVPYWSHDFDSFDVFDTCPDFPPSDFSLSLGPQFAAVRRPDRIRSLHDVSDSEPGSIAAVDIFDRENQVNFVMDLFHQRVEESSMGGDSDLLSPDRDLDPNFGVIEGNAEMGSGDLALDLGLGLDFCTNQHGLGSNGGDDQNCGFMVADCDDEFFVSRRGSPSESGESSTACSGGEQLASRLRLVGIESDSEEDENEDVWIHLNGEDICGLDNVCDDDTTSLGLCWDSFQLEDHRDADEDLSMFFDADVDEDLDASVSTLIPTREVAEAERAGSMANLEWEVLLNVHNLETIVDLEHDGEPYLGDGDEYNYTAEYEVLIGEFAETENALVGRPPASKTVVESLPLLVVDNNNSLCAVCKDEIKIGEQAKQLPCSHHYHGDCIVPWLAIRNTCPVCRYELPTDDPDYERRKTLRARRVQ